MTSRLTPVESALADLERALGRDASHVVLATTPGPETDILIGALAERLTSSFRVVRLAGSSAAVGGLLARILDRLGEPSTAVPERALAKFVASLGAADSALVVLIRNADAAPPEALRQLGQLAAASRGSLRLGLFLERHAVAEDDAIATIVSTLGVGAQKVLLNAPELPRAVERPRAHSSVEQKVRRPGRAAGVLAVIAVSLLGVHQLEALGALAPFRGLSAAANSRAPRVDWPTVQAAAAVFATTAVQTLAGSSLSAAVHESGTFAVVTSTAHPHHSAPPEAVRTGRTAPLELPAPASTPHVPETTPQVPATTLGVPATTPREAQIDEPEPVLAAIPIRRVDVSVNAIPWAHIEVDGDDIGATPMGDLKLARGAHRVRARFPDGRVVEKTVRVGASELHLVFR